MAAKRDLYEVLGISPSATPEELRKAFRRMAAQYHPDRNKDSKTAEDRFKEINEAYQILSDETKRTAYDQFGFAGIDGGAGMASQDGFTDVPDVFSVMQDVFAEVFGAKIPPGRRSGTQGARRGGSSWARKGADLTVEFPMTFHESVFGCRRTVTVRSAAVCSECNGSGAYRGTKPEVCPLCRGVGEVSTPRGFIMFAQACTHCQGVGYVVQRLCDVCHGNRVMEHDRAVDVHFPPGMANGHRVTMAGFGMPGTGGGLPGDLFVVVSVKPDPRFERVDDDLVTHVHVLFTTALLGGDIRVPVLDPAREDATISVTLPPGTQPGAMIRLPGHGVNRWDGSRRGCLVVTIHVDLPAKLSDRARTLIEELNGELLLSLSQEASAQRLLRGDDSARGDSASADLR